MNHNTPRGGQGVLAALLRPLRMLLGEEPASRQQARMLDIQQKFGLHPGDSIFMIVAILEAYLQLVEASCLDVRRLTRKFMWTCCQVGVTCGLAVALPVYFIDMHRAPPSAPSALETPPKAFLRATVARMPESDIERIASSRDALSILDRLPHATDQQLQAIDQYLQTHAGQGSH